MRLRLMEHAARDGFVFLPNHALKNVEDEWIRIAVQLGMYLDMGASLRQLHFCDDGTLLCLPSRPVTIMNLRD